jgi:hypothetical protein
VFARLSATGPAFVDWAGPLLQVLDNMADRSPAGRLRVAARPSDAGALQLEGVPGERERRGAALVTHASASGAAVGPYGRASPKAPRRRSAIEQLLPFASDYGFFDRMGGAHARNGHTVFGTQHSIHSGYGALGDYERSLAAAHGEARANAVLSFSPQNSILYPSVAFKTRRWWRAWCGRWRWTAR